MMQKVARIRSGHPLVRKIATDLIHDHQIPSQDFINEARVIGEFVQKNIRYMQDPLGIERLEDPVLLLEKVPLGKAHGDCDDMALLTATMLLSIGHEPSFRAIRYSNEYDHYDHIYVVDYCFNRDFKRQDKIVIDAIFKDEPIGFETDHSSEKDYPL